MFKTKKRKREEKIIDLLLGIQEQLQELIVDIEELDNELRERKCKCG